MMKGLCENELVTETGKSLAEKLLRILRKCSAGKTEGSTLTLMQRGAANDKSSAEKPALGFVHHHQNRQDQ